MLITVHQDFLFVCFLAVQDACLRIVDVRGIMGRACAKQWGAHVQSNGLCMCKAMACACAKQWRAHGDGSCKWGMGKAKLLRGKDNKGMPFIQVSTHNLIVT